MYFSTLEYARKHGLHAILISGPESIRHEEYAGGFSADKPHALYSGTKSFWGIAALELVSDGLLELDRPVVDLIPEFAGDIRRGITPRMLLDLSAGYGFGGLGSSVPLYEKALSIPLKNTPGSAFTYGGIPLQVLGAYVARLLKTQTPHDYLRERVLNPAGVTIAQWRELSDGTHPLPTGAHLTAREWLTYGRYVLAHKERFAQALAPSKANARYGLGWWRSLKGLPDDLFYASGSAGQGLYVIPSRDLVVVHFGDSTSYKHDQLLKKALA